MIANKTHLRSNGGHCSKRWLRFPRLIFCLAALFCICSAFEINANAMPRGCTHEETYEYEQRNETTHYVSCDDCREYWTEQHKYDNDQDLNCNRCGFLRMPPCAHKNITYSYKIFSNKTLKKATCNDCNQTWTAGTSANCSYVHNYIYRTNRRAITFTEKHYTFCDVCRIVWEEEHSLDGEHNEVCTKCDYQNLAKTCTHPSTNMVYETNFLGIITGAFCSKCGCVWQRALLCVHFDNHKYNQVALSNGTIANYHITRCDICFTVWSESHFYDTDYYDRSCNGCNASRPMEGGMPDVDLDVDTQNEFAWNVYKLICGISMPLAIISLASCGFRFLGSIFFGTYSSPSDGPDIQKAKKQFLYTALFIMAIILLPFIFKYGIDFFKTNAWKP